MLTLHRAASFTSHAGQLSSNVRPREPPKTSSARRPHPLAAHSRASALSSPNIFGEVFAAQGTGLQRTSLISYQHAGAARAGVVAVHNAFKLTASLGTAALARRPRQTHRLARHRQRLCTLRFNATSASITPPSSAFRSPPFHAMPNHSLKLTRYGIRCLAAPGQRLNCPSAAKQRMPPRAA